MVLFKSQLFYNVVYSFYFLWTLVQRQKRLAKERLLTQLKDTLRKPLHSAPRRANPLHSTSLHGEDEVEAEPVDTNLDLLDYPDNSQPTICRFRP